MSNSFAKEAPQGDPSSAQQEPVTKQEANPDQGFSLTVEGREYKSIDEVAKKIENAELHIQRIEAENAEFRTKLSEANQVEEVLERISKVEQQATDTSGLTPEQVQNIVGEQLTAKEQQDMRAANQDACHKAYVAKYGDNYMEVMQNQAKELGMTLEEVDEIASTNPKLFAKTFIGELKPAAPNTGAPRSSINSDALSNYNTADQSNVRLPLDIRTNKGRIENFELAMKEHLAKL